MTPQEVKLWVYLRALRKSQGARFRRQVPLRGFIVDFACFNPKVIVGIDGGQHAEPAHADRDHERDALLERFGFTVVRFWNNEVDQAFDGVWRIILDALVNARLRDEAFAQDLAQSPTQPSRCAR